jgi:hypothetical protein
LSTVFSIDTSDAAAALVVAPAESLPGFGSGTACPVFTARFVMDPGCDAVVVIKSCAVPPSGSVPTFHRPVA